LLHKLLLLEVVAMVTLVTVWLQGGLLMLLMLLMLLLLVGLLLVGQLKLHTGCHSLALLLLVVAFLTDLATFYLLLLLPLLLLLWDLPFCKRGPGRMAGIDCAVLALLGPTAVPAGRPCHHASN
jgi:hypothetical protein